jgi:signal transduction histidine kinase
MISLVDQTFEYIVAEATQTLSLQCDTVHDSKDELLAGNRTIRRSEGMCAFAVDKFVTDLKMAAKNPEHPPPEKLLIIPDMAKDERFRSVGFSAVQSRLGFYAGVPIISPQGFILGAYSIIDDRPREDGISHGEQQFLADIAATIMDHLETTWIKRKSNRAESMVKGVGLFVEGKSSLREWWLQTGHKSRGSEKEGIRMGMTLKQRADDEYGVDQALLSPRPNKLLNESLVSLVAQSTPGLFRRRPSPKRTDSWKSSTASSKLRSNDSNFQPPHQNESNTTWMDSVQSPLITTATATSTAALSTTFRDAMATKGSTAYQSHPPNHSLEGLENDPKKNEIEDIFSRASNLIREATGVEGVIFFDAGVRNSEGSINPRFADSRAPGSFNAADEVWTTSSSDEEARQMPLGWAGRNSSEMKNVASDPSAKHCQILGWSTRTNSSLYVHTPSDRYLNVPERFLHKMLKRYPHGKVFNFDADGSMSSSEEDCKLVTKAGMDVGSGTPAERRLKRKETKRANRKLEAEAILTFFPGSRSVAFMPLWDANKEKWFAGSISWSTMPTRVFDVEEDLTYLAAFGNSIMAEVSRANALVADREHTLALQIHIKKHTHRFIEKKSDLISSISHELRSPLHGVLASIEILHNTALDSFQESMVTAIDMCGKTLLDVINHVLDYTNISGFTEARKQGLQTVKSRQSNSRHLSQNRIEKLSKLQKINVDLGALTAEVVESVLAGRRQPQPRQNRASADNISSSTDQNNLAPSPGEHVIILLDIEKKDDWVLSVHPGAWRRIVMNLVTNAIKYTDTGFIHISLNSEEVPATKGFGRQAKVTLSVTDSGRGISKEFLQNQLFQPFNQENNLTTGLGLGLSIIHQIVKSLGGTIDFQSEQGSGTQVTVAAAFDVPSNVDNQEPAWRGILIKEVASKTPNMKVCLVGLDVFPDLKEEPTGTLTADCQRMLSLKSSLTSVLVNWLEVEVITSSTAVGITADVFVTTSPKQKEWNSQMQVETQLPLPGCVGGPPLLIVGSDASFNACSISNSEQKLIFVQEP